MTLLIWRLSALIAARQMTAINTRKKEGVFGQRGTHLVSVELTPRSDQQGQGLSSRLGEVTLMSYLPDAPFAQPS